MLKQSKLDSRSGGIGLDRRRMLVGLMLAAGAGTALARKPRQPIDLVGDRKIDNIIPKKIGSWDFQTTSGLVVPTEDALSAALYSQLLTRVYVNGSDPPIMLLVAQSAGQTGILQIHRPEFCYPAGGFELSPIVPVSLKGDLNLKVNELTATLPGRTEQIIYWTRVGRQMPMSWAEQRLAVASDNLRGLIPDAVLTRISTIDGDRDRAFHRLTTFAEAMLTTMGANRNVLITA
jgi:EpsI family protein